MTVEHRVPLSTLERLVMLKQISAVISKGFEQAEFWVEIRFGLNDTVASTITIGLDLEMNRAWKHTRITIGFVIGRLKKCRRKPNEFLAAQRDWMTEGLHTSERWSLMKYVDRSNLDGFTLVRQLHPLNRSLSQAAHHHCGQKTTDWSTGRRTSMMTGLQMLQFSVMTGIF